MGYFLGESFDSGEKCIGHFLPDSSHFHLDLWEEIAFPFIPCGGGLAAGQKL